MSAKNPTPECEEVDDGGFHPASALAFWCCLAASAALFAAVALAPRVRTYLQLEREYSSLQRKLVSTERQVEDLQKVADALENDPHFAEELARVDFGASGDEERIAVDPKLSLGGAPNQDATPAVAPDPPMLSASIPMPFVNAVCEDRSVRTGMLAASTLLVVVAFTFLCGHGSKAEDAATESPGFGAACRRWIANRYSKS